MLWTYNMICEPIEPVFVGVTVVFRKYDEIFNNEKKRKMR